MKGFAGGPFGIEEAVGAAGPLPVFISLFVLGFFWALPQALMTAELSTIYPENGGYIVWVYACKFVLPRPCFDGLFQSLSTYKLVSMRGGHLLRFFCLEAKKKKET